VMASPGMSETRLVWTGDCFEGEIIVTSGFPCALPEAARKSEAVTTSVTPTHTRPMGDAPRVFIIGSPNSEFFRMPGISAPVDFSKVCLYGWRSDHLSSNCQLCGKSFSIRDTFIVI